MRRPSWKISVASQPLPPGGLAADVELVADARATSRRAAGPTKIGLKM